MQTMRTEEAIPNNVKLCGNADGESESQLSSTTDSSSCLLAEISPVGRRKEIDLLGQRCNHIRNYGAKAEMILIYGESGSGKSHLVAHIEKTKKQVRDLWCTGKFGQLEEDNRHFGTIIEATTDLCQSIHSSLYRDLIISSVLQDFGDDDLKALTDVVPALHIFSTKRSSHGVARLSDSAEQPRKKSHPPSRFSFQRFTSLYRRFLGAVANDFHPVVIFLDDLQWADSTSRVLLESISQDPSLRNLLIVGTVRTGETTTFNPPSCSVGQVTTLTLDGLNPTHVNKILSLATKRNEKETKELAGIVFTKTMGNPLFVVQYIDSLHRMNLLSYSSREKRYEWDTEAIASRTNVTENIVTLLEHKIQSMSPSVRIVLAIAACLGFRFDASMLDFVMQSIDIDKILVREKSEQFDSEMRGDLKSSHKIKESLEEAVKARLIEKTRESEEKYKFSHDRVQESAARLMPAGRHGLELRVQLGKTILELSRRLGHSDCWTLFLAVDILAKCAVGSGDMDAAELAQLCLVAAQKAHDLLDFHSASKYASFGFLLVGNDDGWTSHHEICLELGSLLADSHYSLGHAETCRDVILSLVGRQIPCKDRARLYSLYVRTFGLDEDWQTSTKEGARCLRELGVHVPVPSRVNLLRGLAQVIAVKRLLRSKNLGHKDIAKLPAITNPAATEIIRLLFDTQTAAFFTGQDYFWLCVGMKQLIFTIEHGVCEYSPTILAGFGLTLAHLGNFSDAIECGEVALKMVEHPRYKESSAAVILQVHSFLWHLKRPVWQSVEPLRCGYTNGLATGDVAFALFCVSVRFSLGTMVCTSLSEMEAELYRCYQAIKVYNRADTIRYLEIAGQAALNLMGRSDNPLKLSGTYVEDEGIYHPSEDNLNASANRGEDMVISTFYTTKVINLAIMGEFEAAIDQVQTNAKFICDEKSTFVFKVFRFFFFGLSYLVTARKQDKKKSYYLRMAARYEKKIKPFHEIGCPTTAPMMALFRAERKAIRGKVTAAVQEYNEAILLFEGLPLLQALAFERAGDILVDAGRLEEAGVFLQKSWEAFGNLCALAKQEKMKRRYRGVVKFRRVSKSVSPEQAKAA